MYVIFLYYDFFAVFIISLKSRGRALDQVARRQSFMADKQVRQQASACELYSGQKGAGIGVPQSTNVFVRQCHFSVLHTRVTHTCHRCYAMQQFKECVSFFCTNTCLTKQLLWTCYCMWRSYHVMFLFFVMQDVMSLCCGLPLTV